MRLSIHLTYGWDAPPDPGHSAAALCANAWPDSESANNRLPDLLRERSLERVYALDALFRRRPGGDQLWKRFVAAVLEDPAGTTITCDMDVFAYSFVRSAKNFHFYTTLDRAMKGPDSFFDVREAWREQIGYLERLEAAEEGQPEADYLQMRQIAARRSARDEWRAVAALLWSGPMSEADISQELGLRFALGPRVLAPFVHLGVLEVVPPDSTPPIYRIARDKVPWVLFFLKKRLGLEPLGELWHE